MGSPRADPKALGLGQGPVELRSRVGVGARFKTHNILVLGPGPTLGPI